MKTFVCLAVLVACVLAAPAPEEGKRDRRSLGWGASPLAYSAYSLDEPLFSHAALAYSAPAVVSVKRIVTVPRVVSVKKIVSVPHVARYVAPRISYSYAPSYSAGWW